MNKISIEEISFEEASLADRLCGWWYRIAAPPAVPDTAPLRDRMRARSGKLTSVIFLIQIIYFLITLVAVLFNDPIASPSIVVMLVVLAIGAFYNRRGKTNLAGILVLIFAEIGLIIDLLMVPGGFSSHSLSLVNFFIVPELIAASLLIPWIGIALALCNSGIIIGMIIFMHKTPDILHFISTHPLNVYTDSAEVQILVAVVIYLWVTSTYREMRRANSAEEVSKLSMEIAMQQQTIKKEKQQLEESIQQIVDLHMQVANGNWNVRIPLNQQNVLWSIAGSLNNLLDRLQRWRHEALQFEHNEQYIQKLIYDIQLARRLGKPLQPYTTGTSLDALISEISKGIAAPQEKSDQVSPNTSHPTKRH